MHFIEQSEAYDSTAAVLTMESSLQQAIGLATKLHALHTSLSVDQNYLSRVSAQEGQGSHGWEEDAMLSK